MTKATPRRAFTRFVARTLMTGAKQAHYPRFIEPMHPTLHARLPAGPKWQYEIKLDGWRGQLHRHRGAAKMLSRNGNDLMAQCATIAAADGRAES